MTSFKNQIYETLVKLAKKKKFWSNNNEFIKKDLEKNIRIDLDPIKKITKNYITQKKEIEKFIYYSIKSKNKEAKYQIFYFHGGGYINAITKYHWNFIDSLMNKLNCEIIVPLYPLAPEYCYKDVYNFLEKLLINIRDLEKTTIFMGDSSGGGISLALAQRANELKLKKIDKIVLLSPFLDLSLKDERIKTLEKKDPFLAISGLKYAAQLYANKDNLNYYLLSPINGLMDNLGEITIITGTKDILNIDSKNLKEKLCKNNIKCNYLELKNLIHCFMLFKTKEAEKVLLYIIKMIEKN